MYNDKCLEVMIDEHLSWSLPRRYYSELAVIPPWSYHVDYACKKVYASLSLLRRVRPYVDESTLTILYL